MFETKNQFENVVCKIGKSKDYIMGNGSHFFLASVC